MHSFVCPWGTFELSRRPLRHHEPLQPFDAADEYLLAEAARLELAPGCRVLVVNDSFGARAVSLAGHARVVSSGDSHLAYQALQDNLARAGLAADAVSFVPASEALAGPFDWVLMRVPKTLALFEEQLIRLHGQLAPGARLVAGAMIKHLPRAAGELLERYIGPLQASLAVKKARLLWATPEPRPQPVSPYPSRYQLDQPALMLVNHANVFCREGLDIGTRAFLPHLPQERGPLRVADLGCGNGILAICYALTNPEAELTLVDESYMALQSARDNWRAALGERPVTMRASDGLEGQPAASLDRVLCNPPFHQQQVVGDYIARRMFQQAHRALVSGGELWLVANRHLGYHVRLQELFGNCTTIAATPKFVVLKAVR